MNYTELIADAARQYVGAANEDKSQRREGTKLAAAQALARLDWVIKAETYGWNPDIHCQQGVPA